MELLAHLRRLEHEYGVSLASKKLRLAWDRIQKHRLEAALDEVVRQDLGQRSDFGCVDLPLDWQPLGLLDQEL